jgi:non-homologous end joining protein Ku
MKGKVVKFEPEDFAALDQLARDRMMSFQELADEAFRDLLKKHGRPTDLKDALRRSAGVTSGAGKHKKHSRTATHRH